MTGIPVGLPANTKHADIRKLGKVMLAVYERNKSKGSVKIERLIEHKKAVYETLCDYGDTLRECIQVQSGDVIKLSKEDYDHVVETFNDAMHIHWEPEIWNIANQSTEGLEGTVFTEEMWNSIGPQLWSWNGQWSPVKFWDKRIEPAKVTDMTAYFMLVVPYTIVDNKKGIFVYEILFRLPKKPEKEKWEQYLPYIITSRIGVGDKIAHYDYYRYCYFLAQKIVALETVRVDRPTARRLKSKQGELSRIKSVSLRRLERKETKDESGIEYKHQWIVSGHTRRQWYPSTKEHKIVFIEPYLKGPENAPVLPFRGTLYHANR